MTSSGRRRRPPLIATLAAVAVVALGLRFAIPLVVDGVATSRSGSGTALPAQVDPAGRDGSPASSINPTTSPPASPAVQPAPTRGKLVIHAAGDVNLDPTYIPNLRTHGYGYAWSGLDGLFERDDLTVVNLECAVSNLGSAVPKQFNFRGDPAALPAMRKAGVEVANLGNNHAYDFGPQALVDTRQNLIESEIAPVGAGRNPREALQATLFEMKGWTVAAVGFDKVVDPYPDAVAAPGHPGTAAGHDLDAMVGAVEEAAGRADIVIVAIHWGVELDTQPRADDVELGRRMIDAGADMIFGGHSHRLQPVDVYKGRPIFYSLGNFVWPNFSVAGSTTAVAEVKVSPGGRFTGRLIPAYIESAGHPVLRGS